MDYEEWKREKMMNREEQQERAPEKKVGFFGRMKQNYSSYVKNEKKRREKRIGEYREKTREERARLEYERVRSQRAKLGGGSMAFLFGSPKQERRATQYHFGGQGKSRSRASSRRRSRNRRSYRSEPKEDWVDSFYKKIR